MKRSSLILTTVLLLFSLFQHSPAKARTAQQVTVLACDRAWWQLFPKDVYFDMVLDEARGRIYATDCDDNALDVIDMTTLSRIERLHVGLQPVGVDISPDGKNVAVATWGDGKVQILDLNTLDLSASISTQIVVTTIGGITSSVQYFPYDVIYGRPGRLYVQAAPDRNNWGRLIQYDTTSWGSIYPSDVYLPPSTRLAITADKRKIYASGPDYSPQSLTQYDVSSDVISETARAPHGPVDTRTLAVSPSGDRVFTSPGQVWSGDLTTGLGSFGGSGGPFSEVEYITATNSVFASSAYTNYASLVDGMLRTPIRKYVFDGVAGVARATSDGQHVYISTSAGIRVVNVGFEISYVWLPIAYKPALTIGK